MEWPLKNPDSGKPSTTPTNQAIFLAAAKAASHEHPELVAAFEKNLTSCPKWRSDYISLVEEFVRIQAKCSPSAAVDMCRAGLEKASKLFLFRPDGSDTTISLSEAFGEGARGGALLETETHHGLRTPEATKTKFKLGSPRGTDQHPVFVSGDKAIKQLEAWKNYGCMEPSAADHARAMCEKDDLTPLVSDKTFVLLGVTSEMGPSSTLLTIPNAHVMGVARSGAKLQKQVDYLKKQGATSTTLQVPKGGADLLKQGPQIAKWIIDTAPADRSLVILPLAYMDGEMNVRVTVAMDQIVEYVLKYRKDVALVYLTSPATAYAIPREAAIDAQQRSEKGNWWMSTANALSFGALAQPNNCWETEEDAIVIFNGIVGLQGPNYCLAKTMQQWRCMLAHVEGTLVAAPHAPGTRTFSVTHSAEAAAGLEGWQYVKPMVAFDVHPCSTLMAAITLDQVSSGKRQNVDHPMQIFFDGSVHGGGWRCPYNPNSVGPVAFVLGKTIARRGWCPPEALASTS